MVLVLLSNPSIAASDTWPQAVSLAISSTLPGFFPLVS
jgi:hypothetical protein